MAGGEAKPRPAVSTSGSGDDLMPGAARSHELGFIPQLFPLKSVGLPINEPKPAGTAGWRLPRCSGAPAASSLTFSDAEQAKAALP